MSEPPPVEDPADEGGGEHKKKRKKHKKHRSKRERREIKGISWEGVAQTDLLNAPQDRLSSRGLRETPIPPLAARVLHWQQARPRVQR